MRMCWVFLYSYSWCASKTEVEVTDATTQAFASRDDLTNPQLLGKLLLTIFIISYLSVRCNYATTAPSRARTFCGVPR